MTTKAVVTALCLLPLTNWLPAAAAAGECGGYTSDITAGTSISITSPSFPQPYSRNSRCIWLLVASNGTQLSLTIHSLQLGAGSNASATCGDYLRITEGSAAAAEVAHLCSLPAPGPYTPGGLYSYLWINFRSDHQHQWQGFNLTVGAVSGGVINTTSPVVACRTTEFTCPNRQCVHQGNLCDSVNDCGCDYAGCDEAVCWTFGLLSSTFSWSVGVSSGIGLSIVMVVVFGLWEMPQRNRPECLKRRRGIEAEVPGSGRGCCGCFGRSNRVEHQQQQQRQGKKGDPLQSMLNKMTMNRHPLRWDTESESEYSRSGTNSRLNSPRHSFSLASSRRSSLYQAQYGSTLSPKDVPPRQASATAGGGNTLTVPTMAR